MNSALAVAIGLTLAIILILKKCHPVYALILGAVVSGLASGWGFDLTIKEMFSGVRDISPAIVRILAVGVTIASASFAQTVLAAGVNAVWAAAMTNAGATVLDHLPHGSFFHATGGSIGMDLKERLRLIPYESMVGLVLVAMSFGVMLVMK